MLDRGGAARAIPRGRLTDLGRYRLSVTGAGERASVFIYDARPSHFKPPAYYPYDPDLVATVTLTPPERALNRRLLGPDGREVEATEAGTVALALGDERRTLIVRRIPDADGEESELEIYFGDRTNGRGSYPAGRFVRLEPLGGDRYRLDFNRGRNPYCAYNTVFACPAPWRGNTLGVAIEAGEQYPAPK